MLDCIYGSKQRTTIHISLRYLQLKYQNQSFKTGFSSWLYCLINFSFLALLKNGKQNWVVTTMKVINELKKLEDNSNINFDVLCQEFDSVSFYGLEYVIEYFFQNSKVKPSVPARSSVDWFGLYNYWVKGGHINMSYKVRKCCIFTKSVVYIQ